MAKSDLFQRSLDAGVSFVGMTRDRAEAVVKEWVEAGDLGRGKAKKAVEDLIDRSQRASEEMRSFVRREIAEELTAIGVATRADVARLEARIDGLIGDGGTVGGGGGDGGTADGGQARVEGP